MSQHDFNIANQGFAAFRSDLNNALGALVSNSSGTTEPTTTYAYQWWYDSTTDILKMRNSANDAWISVAAFNQTTDVWSVVLPSGNLNDIASQAQAEAGTDNTTIMTPLKTAQAIAALGGSSALDFQEFTTSGTWTKPSSGSIAIITLIGGGGGGGSYSIEITFGGSGGQIITGIFSLADLSSSETIVIGAGGSGTTNVTVAGQNGGNSSIGTSKLICLGGTGGRSRTGTTVYLGTPNLISPSSIGSLLKPLTMVTDKASLWSLDQSTGNFWAGDAIYAHGGGVNSLAGGIVGKPTFFGQGGSGHTTDSTGVGSNGTGYGAGGGTGYNADGGAGTSGYCSIAVY